MSRVTRILTTWGIISVSAAAAGLSGYLLYLKESKDQTFLSLIETLVICIITGIALVIDTCWDPQEYKGGRSGEGDSSYSGFLNNEEEEGNRSRRHFRKTFMKSTRNSKKRFKTGYDSVEEQNKRFRDIDFVDPNKYGIAESQE